MNRWNQKGNESTVKIILEASSKQLVPTSKKWEIYQINDLKMHLKDPEK